MVAMGMVAEEGHVNCYENDKIGIDKLRIASNTLMLY